METTYPYKHKVASTEIRTSLRHFLQRFAKQHTDVFKSLSRAGNPYGGNWLSAQVKPAKDDFGRGEVSQPIASLQQRVEELSQEVTLLSNQMNAHQLSAQPSDHSVHRQAKPTRQSTEIGLQRFRALEAER